MTSAAPTVFFVGAGVSFEQPSRVPMAIPVVEALVRTIAPSTKLVAELMPFLRAGRAGEPRRAISGDSTALEYFVTRECRVRREVS